MSRVISSHLSSRLHLRLFDPWEKIQSRIPQMVVSLIVSLFHPMGSNFHPSVKTHHPNFHSFKSFNTDHGFHPFSKKNKQKELLQETVAVVSGQFMK